MRDLLKREITIKILSVLIAIILWLYVYNNSNPFVDRTFTNIPIRIENQNYPEENGFSIKSTYPTIDVTVRGRKEAVDSIKASDFEARLDLSQIKSVNDNKLVITEPVLAKTGVTVASYSPSIINVLIARNKSGSFPVELKPNITMKPGYVLLKTTVSPETVTISGEENTIDSVDSIKASLDIKNLDRDTTKQVQCKVYNKEGKEISGYDLKANVKLEVAKEVPISLVTRGRLAADYIETLRLIEPAKALITGPVNLLDSITDLKTEQVDIDKITGNFTSSVPLIVPEGVQLVNTQQAVNVTINVEKLVVRDIEFLRDDISILNAINDGSMSYDIKTEKLTLQIKGRQSDINVVKPENMKPAVDVSGLDEGTHKLPLNIILPPQVKLLQQHSIEVTISKVQETSGTP